MAEPGRWEADGGGQDVFSLLDEFADVATFPDSLVAWAVDQTPGATLPFPLVVGNRGRGALNLYARTPDAFTTADQVAGQTWAGQASGALSVPGRWPSATRPSTC